MRDRFYFIAYEERDNYGTWIKKNKLINKNPLWWLYNSLVDGSVHLLHYHEITESDYLQYNSKIDSVINSR